VLKLKRPVVARIATITDWPLILIDLITEEGIVGRSYLEPYTIKTMRYLIPALQDFGAMLKGRRVAPVELYDLARKSLHFVGYQGLSMIAVSGLDMAAWDQVIQLEVRWLPPLQNGFDDLRCEQCEPQDAAEVGFVDRLGLGEVAEGGVVAGLQYVALAMGAHNRL
jgi:hypothetical protein